MMEFDRENIFFPSFKGQIPNLYGKIKQCSYHVKGGPLVF